MIVAIARRDATEGVHIIIAARPASGSKRGRWFRAAPVQPSVFDVLNCPRVDAALGAALSEDRRSTSISMLGVGIVGTIEKTGGMSSEL
jgi:hypothetical protein